MDIYFYSTKSDFKLLLTRMAQLDGFHYLRDNWDGSEDRPCFINSMDIFTIDFEKKAVHQYVIANAETAFVVRERKKSDGSVYFKSENALTPDSIGLNCSFKHKDNIMKSSRFDSVHTSPEAKRIFAIFKKIVTSEAKRMDVPSLTGGTFKSWLMPEAIEYLNAGYKFA